MRFDAVVLAGGAGLRSGVPDKTAVSLAGASLLERAVTAVRGAVRIVVVAPRRELALDPRTAAAVAWTLERPPGSGPAAAVEQALSLVSEPVVVVLAADVPFAEPVVGRLRAALEAAGTEVDAAMALDPSGRRQPLLAAYRLAGLRARAVAGPWTDRAVREFVDGLHVIEVQASDVEALDCDTPADLKRAAELMSRPTGL